MPEYAYETEMAVRFRDLDALGHVNNAVYATYVEQARVKYYEDVVGLDLDEMTTVIADIDLDYRAPITWGQTVTVGARVPDLGTASFPMTYEVRADGDVAATAETTIVVVDPDTGESRPIPDDWRAAITEFEGLSD
ncbi:acyl-CoA thioesterase [Halobacteriaceae archaeon GCM10025711]